MTSVSNDEENKFTTKLVLVDKKAQLATVTLNRPDAMNALSGKLMK